MMFDPIADMLTRIRNANKNMAANVIVPHSKMKEQIAKILKEEGYIVDFFVKQPIVKGKKESFPIIEITLKYKENQRIITDLKKISKPGLRVYAATTNIPKVLNGLGIAIISTSNGLMTDKAARAGNIGGEVLAYIW